MEEINEKILAKRTTQKIARQDQIKLDIPKQLKKIQQIARSRTKTK